MLKRVSIQNFKSLKDVTLDLQKVNLLIGPNNSGKTNFLKALEFCSTAVDVSNSQEKITGLFNRNLFRHKYGGPFIKLILEFEGITFNNTEEAITISVKPSNNLDRIQVNLSSKSFLDKEVVAQTNISIDETFKERLEKISKDVLVFDGGTPEEQYIFIKRQILVKPLVYKPDPNKLNKPAPVGRGANFVSADASNLIAFFDRIRDEYPSTFDQIKADLAKCVPEFTEINFQNVEPTEELVKQFGDKTFKRIGLTDSRQEAIYWADELSEGTLYFIALLCIINQPNPPKLLLLEEPEKGIHPRRISEVINFIFRLADDKGVQVIMTTHSPVVVDMFKDMPESVFIFDKDEEGATHVKNLQKDIIEPETAESERLGFDPPRYLDGLGEAWKVGFLGGVPR